MDRLLQFQNLIECSSLEKKIHSHLCTINEEVKRLDFILDKKLKKSDRYDQITQELHGTKQQIQVLEKDLQQKYQTIERSKEHLSLASNQKQADTLEREIQSLTESIETLEEQSLTLMEQIENQEAERDELHSFLEGVEATISELNTEIENIKTKEKKEIQIYEARIKDLLSNCDKDLSNAYAELAKKNRFDSPITFFKGKNCRECGFMIDESARDSVDRSFQLEFCSSCGRIICPMSATTAS